MNEKSATPTKITGFSPELMSISWSSGDHYTLPYFDLRFECPCAGCVDEHTGERIIQKESISKAIKPQAVVTVGRYAVQIAWNDGHSSGIYPYDKLFKVCEKYGQKT